MTCFADMRCKKERKRKKKEENKERWQCYFIRKFVTICWLKKYYRRCRVQQGSIWRFKFDSLNRYKRETEFQIYVDNDNELLKELYEHIHTTVVLENFIREINFLYFIKRPEKWEISSKVGGTRLFVTAEDAITRAESGPFNGTSQKIYREKWFYLPRLRRFRLMRSSCGKNRRRNKNAAERRM